MSESAEDWLGDGADALLSLDGDGELKEYDGIIPQNCDGDGDCDG